MAKKQNNQLGQNIVYKLEGDILTLMIDLSKNLGDTKSKKSISIATTNGNIDGPQDVKIGINVYRAK